MRPARVALAVALTMILCSAIWVLAQDRKAVGPSMKVLLENDRVRAQEHYLKPGEKIGNIGATEVRNIVIELKEQGAAR